MTENKKVVEKYLDGLRKSDFNQTLSCLSEDVEWEVPGVFYISGKEAFDKELKEDATAIGSPYISVLRMTEENDVVIAEGAILSQKRYGGISSSLFCEAYTLENARIKRIVTYQVPLE